MEVDDLYALRNLANRLFEPLERACSSRDEAALFLAELGYLAPGPVAAFEKLRTGLGAIDDMFLSISTLTAKSSAADIASAGQQALQSVRVAAAAFDGLAADLESDFAGSPILTQTDLVAQVARRLGDHLVGCLLESYYESLSAGLNLFGLIETELIDASANGLETEHIRRTIHWDRLQSLVGDPIGMLTSTLTEGNEVLLYRLLYFANLFGVSFDLPAGFRSPDDLILRHFNNGADLLSEADSSRLVTLQVPFTDDPGSQPALEFYPVRDPATKAFTAVAATLGFHSETEVPLGERYRLAAKVSANLSGGLGVRLSNDGQFQLSNGLLSGSAQALANSVPLGARLSIEPVDDDPPAPLVQFGAPGGSRFQIGSGALSFGIERQDALDLFFEGELRDGLIELRTEEADSFIATLLPKGGISSSFSLGLGFSNRTGFYFKGSASLSIRAPVHVSLGPVNVNYLGFAVSAIDDHLVLDVTAGLGAKFGPLSVTVDEVGLRAKLATRDDRSGISVRSTSGSGSSRRAAPGS